MLCDVGGDAQGQAQIGERPHRDQGDFFIGAPQIIDIKASRGEALGPRRRLRQVQVLRVHDNRLAVVHHRHMRPVFHIVVGQVFHHRRVAAPVDRHVQPHGIGQAQSVIGGVLNGLVAPGGADRHQLDIRGESRRHDGHGVV